VAADEVVRNYFAAVDLLRQQRERPLSELKTVAVGTQLAAQKRLLQEQRRHRRRQIGDTKLTELKIQSTNLDNSDPRAGRVPTVVVDVCWDVRWVDVVDKHGKSVISASRPDAGWTRYTVANYKWAADPSGGWRVAGGEDLKRAPCAAS
jgi:hypothetical protein